MAEKTTLARPYAKALFETASDKDEVDSWSDILFVLGQISADKKVMDVVNNPDTSVEDSINLFKQVGKELLDDKSMNLIQLAAENDRLGLFTEIAQEYEILKSDAEGFIEAEVVSAYAVNAEQKKLIIDSLEKRFNKQVTITTSIDKSLLGGIIIRAGDLVIDGSVANQLQKITHTLMR